MKAADSQGRRGMLARLKELFGGRKAGKPAPVPTSSAVPTGGLRVRVELPA